MEEILVDSLLVGRQSVGVHVRLSPVRGGSSLPCSFLTPAPPALQRPGRIKLLSSSNALYLGNRKMPEAGGLH